MEQQSAYNQNEPPSLQEQSRTPNMSFLEFYVIGGIVLVAVFAASVLLLSDTTRTPAEAHLSLQTDQGTFQREATVSELGNNVLVWNSLNAESCHITSSANGRAIEVSTNNELGGPRRNTSPVPLRGVGHSLPRWLETELPVDLTPGEEVTYTLACDDATDTITIRGRLPRLTDFKKAENRWVSRFDTTSIPTNAFKAFYFNSLEPNKVIETKTVPTVAIGYSWSNESNEKTPAIPAEDFGGYWVGKKHIPKAGLYSVVVSLSWSEARIIIDGHEIPSGTETNIELDEGVYQVEVEYLNNRGGVDFMMAFEPTKTKYNLQELKNVVSAEKNMYDVWYVYGYNESPTLNITQTAPRPTIIFLESYDPTQWQINNAVSNNIAYIVYTSFEPGANVTSDLAKERILLVDQDVIPDPNSAGVADTRARCWTDNYPPRCDNVYTVSNLDRFAKDFSGGSLTGFTALTDEDANVASITIPKVSLNETGIREILAENEKIKKDAEAEAKKGAGASVETLFLNQ